MQATAERAKAREVEATEQEKSKFAEGVKEEKNSEENVHNHRQY